MSDSEQDVPLVVRGFPGPTTSNGHKMWPREVTEMTAAKFAAGHTVAAIARDVLANKSLVGKWVRQLRSDEATENGAPRKPRLWASSMPWTIFLRLPSWASVAKTRLAMSG